MKRTNILITGGLGFLGRNIAEFLSKKKNNVFILDKNKNIFKEIKIKISKKKIFIGNFLNKALVNNIILKKKIHIILHLGAITQVNEALDYPLRTYSNNIMGTVNLLEAIRKIDKKIIFIFASSDKAYGECKEKSYKENSALKGVYPYDLSKLSADLICQSYSKVYKLKIGILRCGNLYGPGDINTKRIVPDVINSILKNKKIVLRSDGNQIRDYLYITDAINAYNLLINYLKKNRKLLNIYNVGSKDNLSALKITKLIIKVSKVKKKNVVIVLKNSAKNEIKYQKLNYNKIYKELGWRQKVRLITGLRKIFIFTKKSVNKVNNS